MTTKTDILHVIRGKCLDCSGYQPREVRDCPVTHCGLWPYRMGVDPAPGPARGCAKSPLGRSGIGDERVSPVSGSGDTGASREPLLPRDGFGRGEAVQRHDLLDGRRSAPVQV